MNNNTFETYVSYDVDRMEIDLLMERGRFYEALEIAETLLEHPYADINDLKNVIAACNDEI